MPAKRDARGRFVKGTGTGGAASSGVRFQVINIKEVQKRLLQLEPKIQRKVVRSALRKAAKPIADRTRQLAPRGKTGQIKANVKIRAMKRTRRGTIGVRVQIGRGDVRGDQYYAAFVEFGTRRSGKGYSGRGTKPVGQRGQHYMQRAFEQTKGQANRIAVAEIASGIEREAKG